MLEIYISENHFENRKKSYIFRSRNCGTVTCDDFIRMIAESNTTVTQPDTMAVMSLIERKFDELIHNGYAVQLPMGTFRAGVSGTADSTEESFHPTRSFSPEARKTDHTFSLLFEPNRKKEKKLPRAMNYQYIRTATICSPFITSLHLFYKKKADVVEQGDILTARGDYLKIDFSDDEQGLYLCSSLNEQKLYRIQIFVHNARKTLMFKIPDNIPDGEYRLHVNTKPAKALLTAVSPVFRIQRNTAFRTEESSPVL
jgi:hypothetical protein